MSKEDWKATLEQKCYFETFLGDMNIVNDNSSCLRRGNS